MTPKEKAIQLYDKFHVWDTMNHKEVKTLALIAVDEILESNPTLISCDGEELNYAYWIEVKKEIEKL
jgi:hypothetical protein